MGDGHEEDREATIDDVAPTYRCVRELVAERDGWKQTVTAMMGEEERLRAVLDRLREQAGPIVADGNPDDDAYTEGNLTAWTYVHHVLGQLGEGEEVTDGNLRAVVEAARVVLAVIDSTRPGRLLAGLEGRDEVTLLRERLDRLDGSEGATDG